MYPIHYASLVGIANIIKIILDKSYDEVDKLNSLGIQFFYLIILHFISPHQMKTYKQFLFC